MRLVKFVELVPNTGHQKKRHFTQNQRVTASMHVNKPLILDALSAQAVCFGSRSVGFS